MMENPERIIYGDQDALNSVVNGNFYSLDPYWNYVPLTLSIFSNYASNIMKKAMKNPAIIHVAGSIKPWNYMCDTQYQSMYRDYRKDTTWAKIEYKDKTIKNMLKKHVVGNIEKLIGERNINILKAHAPGKEKFWISKIAKMRVR